MVNKTITSLDTKEAMCEHCVCTRACSCMCLHEYVYGGRVAQTNKTETTLLRGNDCGFGTLHLQKPPVGGKGADGG